MHAPSSITDNSRCRSARVGACLAAALAAHAAPAQVLDEIIVTAQKREQSLQDVGIAITAFTAEQMEALGFESSTDIALMSPGVYINSNTAGQNRQFTIRGVSQNDFFDALEAPIAAYVDEAYIPMQQGQVFALFDVERVEILKGPQGTLFGRNATGGLVHYITRKPTFEPEGYVDLTYGSYDQVRVEAAAGGRLTEAIAGRVAVMYNRYDEILENEYPLGAVNIGGAPEGGGEDLYNDDTWAARGHVLIQPDEDVEILLSGFGSRTVLSESALESSATVTVFDAQGRAVNAIFASPTETREAIGPGGVAVPIVALDAEFPGVNEDATRPVPGGDLFGFRDADLGDFETSHEFAFDDLDEFETWGATAKLTWDLGAMTLTSVSDYKNFDKFVALDVGSAPADQFIFAAEADTESFSQELRLNGELERARWVAGFYFLYIDNVTDTGFLVLPTAIISPLFFGAGIGADLIDETKLETTSYSVFGQIDFDLTETLTFIAGLRTIIEDKEYDFEQNLYISTNDKTFDKDVFVAPLTAPFHEETSDTLWAGKLQFEWQPNDDWLVYAGLNRGVKAGSFNAKLPDGSPPLSEDEIGYDEEVLYAYEVGFKSTLFGGTTRLNGSFYFYDYDDYQASTFSNVSAVVSNEDAKVKGVEVELITSPLQGFDLMLGASFNDAEVNNVAVAPGVPRDVQPTYAPSVQYSGLARYAWPAFGGELSVQGHAYYVSHVFHNLRNFATHKLESYLVGNARVAWMSGDERWQASFFVNNIADERYRVESFALDTLCGCNEELFAKPRWFGGTLRYNF
jgi:iron complex outermembrane receptor protein